VTVRVLPRQAIAPGQSYLDVTTHGRQFRPLSPMLLGPVPLYAGVWSKNMENAWQFSKVYPQFGPPPAEDYWAWAMAGWNNPVAVRYPMGQSTKPLYSAWAGQNLDYVTARKRIYIPLYAQAVRLYQYMLLMHLTTLARLDDIILCDFDAYDHRALGYSWDDVISDPDRKMGHGFVLAMMIEGVL
jgi:hypothetical protein